MDLLRTKQVLLNNITALSLDIHMPSKDSYLISGLKRFRLAVRAIEETGAFKTQTTLLKKSEIFKTASDDILIEEDKFGHISPILLQIKYGAKGMIDVIDSAFQAATENAILVKLPETEDLKEITKILSEFEKALSLAILHPDIGGEIRVQGVQSGSIWFKISVGSFTALSLVGSMFWSAAVITKKFSEAEMLAEKAKAMRVRTETLQDLLETIKKENDLILEAEAKHLYSENYKPNEKDLEQINRLRHSVTIMAELIHKGTEVHPALEAPENVSNLFPNVSQMPLLESKIKKIENQ